MKTVASGREDGPATFIPNHNLLTFTVNPYFHILALYSTMFNIQPIRQITRLPTVLNILYPDGITCYSLHLQLSVAKRFLSKTPTCYQP